MKMMGCAQNLTTGGVLFVRRGVGRSVGLFVGSLVGGGGGTFVGLTSVCQGDMVNAAVGLALCAGAGDIVGANDQGDEAQKGLPSLLSKHLHCAGEIEKSHSPRPAQLAGHMDLRVWMVA
jgi:hypothetical protein